MSGDLPSDRPGDHPGALPTEASAAPSMTDLRAALAELDPAYRELYALHAFDLLTDEQIAERLSIQQVIVGPLLGRARKKLHEVLRRKRSALEGWS
jgi:DNA-directed RNA polymerase specialized sigma24 family protein